MLRFNLTTINKAGWASFVLAIIVTVIYMQVLKDLRPILDPITNILCGLALYCWAYTHGARDEAKVGN